VKKEFADYMLDVILAAMSVFMLIVIFMAGYNVYEQLTKEDPAVTVESYSSTRIPKPMGPPPPPPSE
jgi:hypothetical protein